MAIYISDNHELDKKILKIKQNTKNLHIIVDFDRTLTKAFVKGIKVHTLFGQLLNHLGKKYCDVFDKLYKKYQPVEISSISVEEKIPKMIDWWKILIQTAIDEGISNEIISKIIKDNKIYLREGAIDFFNKINKKNIPVLIFSAGLGDIISEFLKSKKIYSKNIHIISNFFIFGDNGKVIGTKPPLVYSFNKNEFLVRKSSYFSLIKKKKNVLLLGDLIEDTKMADGLNHDCILKIGFLNNSEDLASFQKVYDIVITKDGSFEAVNNLLDKILN